MLRYVQKGGDLNPLLVGKMAVEHIPIIKELQYRKVLKPAPIMPRYLQDAAAIERLARLRGRQRLGRGFGELIPSTTNGVDSMRLGIVVNVMDSDEAGATTYRLAADAITWATKCGS